MRVSFSLALSGIVFFTFCSLTVRGASKNNNQIQTTLGVTGYSDLKAEDDITSRNGVITSIQFVYPHSSTLSTALSTGLNSTNRRNNETLLQNTQIATVATNDFASPRVVLTLPTNEKDREDNSLQGALALGVSRSIKTTLASVNVTLDLKAQRNIHQYTQNSAGDFNTQWLVTPFLATRYQPVQRLSFEIAGAYTIGRTYHNIFKEQYEISETLSYTPDKNLRLALRHSNGADPLGYDGRDRNVKFFSTKTSMLAAEISYQY